MWIFRWMRWKFKRLSKLIEGMEPDDAIKDLAELNVDVKKLLVQNQLAKAIRQSLS